MDLTEFNFTDIEGASPKCWSYVKHKNFISWWWTKHTLGCPLPLDPFEITVKRYKGNKGIVVKRTAEDLSTDERFLSSQTLLQMCQVPHPLNHWCLCCWLWVLFFDHEAEQVPQGSLVESSPTCSHVQGKLNKAGDVVLVGTFVKILYFIEI